MITVYSVQTFYGTYSKIFQRFHNAIAYYNKLSRQYDADLLEFRKLSVSEEELGLLDIED